MALSVGVDIFDFSVLAMFPFHSSLDTGTLLPVALSKAVLSMTSFEIHDYVPA